MHKRKKTINWKIALLVVLILTLPAVLLFQLNKWQKNRMLVESYTTGMDAYSSGNWDTAAKYLGRYVAVAATDTAALHKYADAQLNRRPLKEDTVKRALNAYRIILRLQPDDIQASERLITMYLKMQAPGEAELIATNTLEVTDKPQIAIMLATSLIAQRKFDQAIELLDELLQKHPGEIEPYEIIGNLAARRPDSFKNKPQHYFDLAISSNENNAMAYIIRAGFYIEQKQNQKAFEDLIAAEEKNLENSAVRLALAKQFIRIQSPDKARRHLDIIAKDEPSDEDYWRTHARLAIETDSKEEMLDIATNSLKALAKQKWDFMPIAIELLIRAGETESALSHLDELRKLNIAPQRMAFLEGLMALYNNDKHLAVRSWQQAILMGDTSVSTTTALAELLSQLGDNTSALKLLNNSIVKNPDSFETRLRLAQTYYQNSNASAAAKHADRAVLLEPENIKALDIAVRARLDAADTLSDIDDTTIILAVSQHIETLARLTNDMPRAALLKAELMTKMENYSDAEKILATLSQGDNSEQLNRDIAIIRTDMLVQQDRIDDAISLLRTTHDTSPNTDVSKYLSHLLSQTSQYDKCQDILDHGLANAKSPRDKRAFTILIAKNKLAQGNKKDALLLYQQLLSETPESIPLLRKVLSLTDAETESEKAQQIIDSIHELEGERGWQWKYEQARLWYLSRSFSQKYAAIVSSLKNILHMFPGQKDSLMLLALSYEKAGNTRLAIAAYNEAINLNPHDMSIFIPSIIALNSSGYHQRVDNLLNHIEPDNINSTELLRLKLQSYFRNADWDNAEIVLNKLMEISDQDVLIPLSLCRIQMHRNEFALAEKTLCDIAEEHHEQFDVIAANIELCMLKNAPQLAIEHCDKLVRLFGNSKAYLHRAKIYAAIGQTYKAITDFERSTELDPSDLQAWLDKSTFYAEIGDTEDAITNIQQALKIAPSHPEIHDNATRLFITSKDKDIFNKGAELLDQLLRSEPQNVDFILLKAKMLINQNTASSLEQANTILQRTTDQQPQNDMAWKLRADTAIDNDQHGKAMDIILTGLIYLPDNKPLLILKAKIEASKSPALAMPTLQILRERHPDDMGVAKLYADNLIDLGKTEQAQQVLNEQLDRHRTANPVKLKTSHAVATYKSGDMEGADREFDLLYKQFPGNPYVLLARLKILKQQQKWNRIKTELAQWQLKYSKDNKIIMIIAKDMANSNAKQALEIAKNIVEDVLQNDTQNVSVMAVYGAILHKMKLSAQAANVYENIIHLRPDDTSAINNLAWITCEELNQPQKALELAHKGLGIAPDYIDLIDTRGVIYHRLGRHHDAINDFKKGRELSPENTPSTVACSFHLARTLAQTNEKEQALATMKRVLVNDRQVKSLSPQDVLEAKDLIKTLSENSN